MSQFTVPFTFTSRPESILSDLTDEVGRAPTTFEPTDTSVTVEWLPDLTPSELSLAQAYFQDVTAMQSWGLTVLTLAQFRARREDLANLKTWLALPEGATKNNNAVPALEALVRIVAVMLKLELNGF
jgi:hypothetical protein